MTSFYGNPGGYVPAKGTFFKKNDVNNNLTITNNLYDIKYRADGSGRDSYIHHANGGLMSHQSPKLNLKSEYLMSGRFIP